MLPFYGSSSFIANTDSQMNNDMILKDIQLLGEKILFLTTIKKENYAEYTEIVQTVYSLFNDLKSESRFLSYLKYIQHPFLILAKT